MKLFEVEAKCGHVGRSHYVVKSFAVKAENGKRAAEIVRWMPRVKHHHKDAIISVVIIDEKRYCEICCENSLDPYFSCECIQEQRILCNLDILQEDCESHEKESASKKLIFCGKMKLRHPKKYMNRYNNDWRVA